MCRRYSRIWKSIGSPDPGDTAEDQANEDEACSPARSKVHLHQASELMLLQCWLVDSDTTITFCFGVTRGVLDSTQEGQLFGQADDTDADEDQIKVHG